MTSKTRTVALDAVTRARWAETASAFELGLLLGQLGRRGPDVVLAAAPVPSESESGETHTFADVSPEWVRDCAQQAERMLPGGVHVIGLYVHASSLSAAVVVDKAAFYLRELAAGASSSSLLYVAHVTSAQSPVFTAFSDVDSASKTASMVTELVDVPGGITLAKYHALVGVSEPILFSPNTPGVTAEDLAGRRAAELKKGFEPFLKRLSAAVCLPDGEATDSQQMKLLAPAQTPIEDVDANTLVGRVKGSVRGLAYVSATETEPAKLAAEYLKSDLLKTVALRVELAGEKWTDEAEESNAFNLAGRVCLPQRHSVVWGHSDSTPGLFDLSVYSFPGDDAFQVAETAFEVLGGLVSMADASAVKSVEHEWVEVEQDTKSRDQRLMEARKDDPDFAPMPYHYVLMLIPVALALVFLLVQQGFMMQRDLKGYT